MRFTRLAAGLETVAVVILLAVCLVGFFSMYRAVLVARSLHLTRWPE